MDKCVKWNFQLMQTVETYMQADESKYKGLIVTYKTLWCLDPDCSLDFLLHSLRVSSIHALDSSTTTYQVGKTTCGGQLIHLPQNPVIGGISPCYILIVSNNYVGENVWFAYPLPPFRLILWHHPRRSYIYHYSS